MIVIVFTGFVWLSLFSLVLHCGVCDVPLSGLFWDFDLFLVVLRMRSHLFWSDRRWIVRQMQTESNSLLPLSKSFVQLSVDWVSVSKSV